MYHTNVKVCCIGLNRTFYRPFSEKVLKKHCFARVLHAICMWIDLQFFWRIHGHNWGRLDSKPSKSVTPRCNATYMSQHLDVTNITMVKSSFVYFNDKTIVIRSTSNHLRRNTRWWSELIVMKQVPRSEYCHLKIRMSLYLIPICYETRDSLSLTESECPTGLVIPYFFIKSLTIVYRKINTNIYLMVAIL